jgi:hypothetical protein
MSQQAAECPDCGCNDVQVLKHTETEGRICRRDSDPIPTKFVVRKMMCGHCRYVWSDRSTKPAKAATR